MIVLSKERTHLVFSLPRRIVGTQASLSDQLTVSILIDRTLTLTVGKATLILLTSNEAKELYLYLHKNKRKFVHVAEGGE